MLWWPVSNSCQLRTWQSHTGSGFLLFLMSSDTLSAGTSVLKMHCCGIPLCMLLGELCRDHLSWPAGMVRSVCLDLIFRGSHSWRCGRSLGPESMLCQSHACKPLPVLQSPFPPRENGINNTCLTLLLSVISYLRGASILAGSQQILILPCLCPVCHCLVEFKGIRTTQCESPSLTDKLLK